MAEPPFLKNIYKYNSIYALMCQSLIETNRMLRFITLIGFLFYGYLIQYRKKIYQGAQ